MQGCEAMIETVESLLLESTNRCNLVSNRISLLESLLSSIENQLKKLNKAGLSMCPLAGPDHPLPASPVRPLHLPNKGISSIFEYIQGIFKEYLDYMSNTPGLRLV